jgi:hypothetical protein
MICETLREVLFDLEQRGKLIRVSKSVDVGWEVACLVKWMFQAAMGMDPSIRVKDSDPGSKVVIDATQTIDAGRFSLPAKDKMTAALNSWREAGLPEFSIPKRARLRMERS